MNYVDLRLKVANLLKSYILWGLKRSCTTVICTKRKIVHYALLDTVLWLSSTQQVSKQGIATTLLRAKSNLLFPLLINETHEYLSAVGSILIMDSSRMTGYPN